MRKILRRAEIYRGQDRHRAVAALKNQKAAVRGAKLTKLMTRVRALARMYYLLGESDVAEFFTWMVRPYFLAKSRSDFSP